MNDGNSVYEANFLDDKEKMVDFFTLSREDFFASYSYLTDEEYDNTLNAVAEKLGIRPAESPSARELKEIGLLRMLTDYLA